MSDSTRSGEGRPVHRREELSRFPRRRRILRIPSGEEELQRALGDGYDVIGAGSVEVPDIVVADLARLDQLEEIWAHPGTAWVIRLPFGSAAADVVAVLDSGADACLIDGPIEILAAQVRSVDRALSWRGGGRL